MSLIHSRLRALGGLVAAGTLALAAPAWAADQAPAAPAAPAADSMVVVRDAETGQLRAPTADEAAALNAARTPATGRSALKGNSSALLETMSHASGAIGVRVSDEMASYSVVTKRADGKLEAACVESKSVAEQAVQSGVLPAQQAAEK